MISVKGMALLIPTNRVARIRAIKALSFPTLMSKSSNAILTTKIKIDIRFIFWIIKEKLMY